LGTRVLLSDQVGQEIGGNNGERILGDVPAQHLMTVLAGAMLVASGAGARDQWGRTLRLHVTLSVGQRFTWQRTFTVEDVRQFSQLSGDRGVHHVQPDTGGRVMVQGLLTATLPTKIGGDLNFIARDMTFEFLRPVFTGETITTDVTFTRVEEQEGRLWASVEAVCTNEAGKEVLLAHIRGFVTNPT
jgi:3-hydroxybutyryl-CoA dehydratase